MNRELLEAPFPTSEIKMRQGNHGTISYVDGASVIQRLNDSFDGNWSFEITDYGYDEDNNVVWAICKLTAENVVKMQFGCSSVTLNMTTQKPVAIVDDMKAAATDALKKAATLLGVGLHRTAKSQDETSTENRPHQSPSPNTSSQIVSKGISTRQLGYLLTLGRGRKMTPSEVDALAEERFGTVLSYLTKAQASALITELRPPEDMTQDQPSAGHTGRDIQ